VVKMFELFGQVSEGQLPDVIEADDDDDSSVAGTDARLRISPKHRFNFPASSPNSTSSLSGYGGKRSSQLLLKQALRSPTTPTSYPASPAGSHALSSSSLLESL